MVVTNFLSRTNSKQFYKLRLRQMIFRIFEYTNFFFRCSKYLQSKTAVLMLLLFEGNCTNNVKLLIQLDLNGLPPVLSGSVPGLKPLSRCPD